MSSAPSSSATDHGEDDDEEDDDADENLDPGTPSGVERTTLVVTKGEGDRLLHCVANRIRARDLNSVRTVIDGLPLRDPDRRMGS